MLQNYLAQYGYLPPINPENGAFLSEEKLTAAIEEFQAFAGLNITGMSYIYICSNLILNVKHVGESSNCAKFITGSVDERILIGDSRRKLQRMRLFNVTNVSMWLKKKKKSKE